MAKEKNIVEQTMYRLESKNLHKCWHEFASPTEDMDRLVEIMNQEKLKDRYAGYFNQEYRIVKRTLTEQVVAKAKS